MSSATRQPQRTASGTTPPSDQDHSRPSSVFDARIYSQRRSTDSSIRSRSSDRHSIIQTHSRESLHTPVSQPAQFPRAPYRQFGRGPSASPSRDSPRSPSPTDRVPQLPHPETDVTNLHPQTQGDSGNSPISPIASGTTPPSDRDHAKPSSVFDTRIHSKRRSTDSSIRSHSSDKLSVIQTHPRESLHAPVGQTTRFPRAPHRQFGRGPSASTSRESSRSPSPTDRVPQPPLETDVTNLHPQTQCDSRNSPINPSSVTSQEHVQLSPQSIPGLRSRQSSTTSVVVGVVYPSTDSLPLRVFTDGLPLTEEPYTIDSPIGHLSVADTLDRREGLPQLNPTASSSSATSNFGPPDGRFLRLINSEEVPRYTKDVTMQVDNILTTIKCLCFFDRPRQRTYYEIPPLTRTFPQYVCDSMVFNV